jgi:hypothetical protein
MHWEYFALIWLFIFSIIRKDFCKLYFSRHENLSFMWHCFRIEYCLSFSSFYLIIDAVNHFLNWITQKPVLADSCSCRILELILHIFYGLHILSVLYRLTIKLVQNRQK